MTTAPPEGTVERWAYDYVTTTSLAHKVAPPPRPDVWAEDVARRITSPGRPAELRVEARAKKRPRAGALVAPLRRAELIHTFWHHELQAAELFAWAMLAFVDTPRAFRAGLLGILDDEVRHMAMYREHIVTLGADVGAFPVRDWFWQRVPTCETPLSFVALMGLGLEAANLDHAARFASQLLAAGDPAGAELEARVGEEEVAHVKFARVWFTRWSGGFDLDAWSAALPHPVSPAVLRGEPMNRDARRRAGFDDTFLDGLAACTLAPRGS